MNRATASLSALACFSLTCGIILAPTPPGHAADDPKPEAKVEPKPADSVLTGSAIEAVLAANDGKPPKTGVELTKTLAKLGKFAQLPVVFSAVRLDSGLGNPRVIITPLGTGISDANVTDVNLIGRLFLAANMEKDAKGGDPRVVSVEFISWNTLRRRFDFGVIEDMGGTEEPQLKLVDGGKCFSCHKNRGPIMGAKPWTNTTHFPLLRSLLAEKYQLVETIPPVAAGNGLRDRIDGMTLVTPQAAAVDSAVRLGALLRLDRETFQLMNRSTSGRKAFVALLLAVVDSTELNVNDRETKRVIDAWANDQSYAKFMTSWGALTKATSTGILADYIAFPKLQVDPWTGLELWPLPSPPPGGFRSLDEAKMFETQYRATKASNEVVMKNLAAQTVLIAKYDKARADGKHGMPSAAQPSNPRAFVLPSLKPSPKPSGMLNPLMLAGTIGLTDGDRHFLSRSLADAAEKINKPKVTAATLARAVFEGPEFADVIAGGPLPDRDEFKDRFVAGLGKLLAAKYPGTTVFAPKRSEYASGPKYDKKLAEEKELAVVPTTACLRCHEVRASGKAKLFEPIPALAFDPFDEVARATWVKTAPKGGQQVVLSRMRERLSKDADMPPHDAPEHDLFRVKQAAAFARAKVFLETELENAKAPMILKKP